MERKLIKQGQGGLTMYLPKKWIDRKGLHEGDSISITETDTSLIISSTAALAKEITITITDDNKHDIRNMLTHVYRNGFEKITFKGLDEPQFKTIRMTLPLLLGFELTQKSDTSCTVENISEPAEQKYDVLMRRVFLIIKETIDLLKKDHQEGYTHHQDIQEYRDQQDRYILFCRRMLAREHEEFTVLNWELLTFLMHIEHGLYYLYQYLAKQAVQDKTVAEQLNVMDQYFSLLYTAYFKLDVTAIHKINEKRDSIIFGTCIKHLEMAKGKSAVAHSYLRELLRLIQVATSPILSMTVQERLQVAQDRSG